MSAKRALRASGPDDPAFGAASTKPSRRPPSSPTERLAAECGVPISFRSPSRRLSAARAAGRNGPERGRDLDAARHSRQHAPLARSRPPGMGHPRMRPSSALRPGRLRGRPRRRASRAPADRASGVPVAVRFPVLPVEAPARSHADCGRRARVPPLRSRPGRLRPRGGPRHPGATCPAENVVLLDLDPPRQKTAVDFSCTEKL